MALTNMLREPKRELIEQGYGLIAVGCFVAVDFALAAAVARLVDGTVHVPVSEFLCCAFISLFVIAAAVVLLLIVHSVGEAICNAMARHGNDPRPRDRYR